MSDEQAAEADRLPAIDGARETRMPWLTVALWVVGIALQFAAGWMRGRVPLSDVLDITSILAPLWQFLLVSIVAGVLWATRKRAARWTSGQRTLFAVAVAAGVVLLQPTFADIVLPGPANAMVVDPVQLALAWSTPLALYVIPVAIVIWAWLRPAERRIPGVTALGGALVAVGLLSLPYVLWLTYLWATYVQHSGGA